MSRQQRPAIPLSMKDILTIDSALQGYLSYVRGAIPCSVQRDVRISKLQDLRTRLTALPDTGTPAITFCIPLTFEDIETLNGALRGFISLVSTFILQSQERDETRYRHFKAWYDS